MDESPHHLPPGDLAQSCRLALRLSLITCALGLGWPHAAAVANAVTTVHFPGANVGAIPDGPGGPCGTAGAPRDVSFEVPALADRAILDVDVELVFNPIHSWAGDVTARLISPGATREHVLFGRVGAINDAGCGDSSDLAGPYVFSDAATPPSGGFWQEASARGAAEALTAGSYFTTGSGGAGAINPMPATSLQAVFGGMSAAESSGVWVLRLTDGGAADIGGIGSARLHVHLDSTAGFRDGFEFTAVASDGSNLGAIPDGPPAQCGTAGPPRDVLFSIPPLPGFRVRTVGVRMTFGDPIHPWAGDVTARLIAPGATREHVLFGRVGAATASGCGDSSDLAGPYVFTDAARPPSGGFWQAASAALTADAIAAGGYFTTNPGGAGATSPMPPTGLQATFGGMTSAEAAGTWTLRLTDSGGGDTGAISAARLILFVEPE